MAIAAISRIEENVQNMELLAQQLLECPKREVQFLKRGMEYLSFLQVYDVRDITEDMVTAYPSWLMERGVHSKKLLGVYKKTLRDWRRFHTDKDFLELLEESDACKGIPASVKNKAVCFLIENGVHRLEEISYDLRLRYKAYIDKEINEKETHSQYLHALDKLKLYDIQKKNERLKAGRIRLQYQKKCLYLRYHPDYEIAKSLLYIRNDEKLLWDFSIQASEKLKRQVLDILNYALENTSSSRELDVYIVPLKSLYHFCVKNHINDLMGMEQNEIDTYHASIQGVKKVRLWNRQVIERVQRVLFLISKETNWNANVWYLERFQFDETRYNPSRPVNRISFLEVENQNNRDIFKAYYRYQLGVTGMTVQNIWAEAYWVKGFLCYLDGHHWNVDKMDGRKMDAYFRDLATEDIQAATYNKKIDAIYAFFSFLKVRGYCKKIPFYRDYYIKKAPYQHHYRLVPQNTVTQILQILGQMPENLRLMYLHLWCLGVRANEVCTIKRKGYYIKGESAWLRIYQHKLKREKVIPIPMMLYKAMLVYMERYGIGNDAYVFQNAKGGPYSVCSFWHDMVDVCNQYDIRCNDHVFQSHDYRHSVATLLYHYGASIQVIREFLGHRDENMTKQYIDCLQEHMDQSSQNYFENQDSLAKEWKRGKTENGK